MTDKQMYQELERFANDCTVARDMIVTVSSYGASFKPKRIEDGFKCEDADYLKRLIDGANAYLLWKRRNAIKKAKSKRG